MKITDNKAIIEKLIAEVEILIPEFLKNPADLGISNGNPAICIIDENGDVYGKLYGTDKLTSRYIYGIAWSKASQVWITGMKTAEFEKAVFNKEIDEHKFGIGRPDYVGYEGGQPLFLENGSRLSVGFSGFRGFRDGEIVLQAFKVIHPDKIL
jgi:hypothetical protein